MKFLFIYFFLFSCGIINNFSTEKEEEGIKCYLCKEIIIKIETDKNNNETKYYTAEVPFASLSCIFNCNYNSFFLCKECYAKNDYYKFLIYNNKRNENEYSKDLTCTICFNSYKDTSLGSCSYFYNCTCKYITCKKCYEGWDKKLVNETKDVIGTVKSCPYCGPDVKKKQNQNWNESQKYKYPNCKNFINNKTNELKNCCQICIGYIKDFFKN